MLILTDKGLQNDDFLQNQNYRHRKCFQDVNKIDKYCKCDVSQLRFWCWHIWFEFATLWFLGSKYKDESPLMLMRKFKMCLGCDIFLVLISV